MIGRRFWVVSLLSCCALLAVQCFAAPSVTSLSPTSGPIGTWVTIAGANFGSTQGTSSVTFNGIPVTTVSSWSATTIVVAVPPGTMTGNVVVTVSGIPSAGTLFTKTTAAPIPQVVQVQPANVATGVPLNARTVVRFAQAVPAVSVVNGLLTLAQGSTSVSGTVTQSNDGLSLTFVPSQNLSSSTAYSVDVTDVAADQTGPQFQSTFTTGTTSDTTAPHVVQLSPPTSATGVPINSPLMVQFTKPMDPATLTPQAFGVTDAGVSVAGTVQVDATGLTASFIPASPLAVGHSISSVSPILMKDTSGNAVSGGGSFSFTTAFTAETQGPTLLGTSPANGATSVPLNAVVVLEFDKPINAISASSLQVLAGGQAVPGGIALSDGNKRITFTPNSALTASTTYTTTTTSQITNVAGLALTNPGSVSFTTGTASDATIPSVAATSPANTAMGVPTNGIAQVQFSKAIDPWTVTGSTILFSPSAATSNLLPGTIAVSPDAKTVTFTPSAALLTNTQYYVRITTGIADIEGHSLSASNSSFVFTTGVAASTTAPTVVGVSPQDGATGVAVNAKVDVVASSPISAGSIGSQSIVVSAGGVAATGTVSLNGAGTTLSFIPSPSFAVSTTYTVTVSGITDQAGNILTPFTSSFTTASSGTADTTKPSVVLVNPANAATSVSVSSPITVTFNEPIDGSTVSNSSITVSSNLSSGVLAGTYSLSSTGTIVTFTPLTPLPGSSTISVRVGASTFPSDLAGNTANSFSSYFTTAATPDTTPPSVVSVTPADGSTNMGLNTKPVVTFSKSLSLSTITSNNFGLFANGARVGAGLSYSADNRVVTLSPSTLPASSTVDVVVTNGVKDLSGNALPYFVSQFSTADQFDYSSPSVSVQRPSNGAINVAPDSSVVLYINEPMTTSTVQGALHVSQNGVLVTGTTQVTNNGQVVVFTPSAPWQYNALIQIFMDSTAIDTDGIALNSYQGSFRTIADTSNTAPTVVSTSPVIGAVVPTNAVIGVQFSQPMDPSSVTGTSLFCRLTAGGWVQGAVSLVYGGQVLQFIPRYPLQPNTSYLCYISSTLRAMNGVSYYGTNLSFTTGAGPDMVVPVLTSVSPPDGWSNVGDNALVRLVFSKPINPLTVNPTTVQLSVGGSAAVLDSITFSNNNQSALFTPHAPFPDNTQMSLTINGITDGSGNPVAPKTTQFTTGTGPDLVRPLAVSTSPSANAVNVPLNAVMVMQMNEPMDPGTVNTNTVKMSTSGQNIPGTVSLSPDGQTITFLPSSALTPSTIYSVSFINLGITDLAGNYATQNGTPGDFTFTTGTASSTSAPQVTGVSPYDSDVAVPTNAQVMVQFNEPLSNASLTGVTLSAGGNPVSVTQVLSNGNQMLTLIPTLPLVPNTLYTLTVSGVQDLGGNGMGSPVSSTFTTSAGANLLSPSVANVSPANYASGISITGTVVRVTFTYPINPLTVNSSTFQLYPNTTHIPVPATISVSADGLTATLTPAQTLDPSTIYLVNFTGGDLDLEGRGLNWGSQFTTASGSTGLTPTILSLSSTSNRVGTLIAINGTYFGTSHGTSTVTFSGVSATVSTWSDTQVYAYVPTGATSGPVVVTVNGLSSNTIVFNVQATPTISNISPTSGPAGTVITISGSNLGNSYDSPTVTGSGFTVSATPTNETSLQATIPSSAYPGAQTLTVKLNMQSSSGVSFTVIGTPGINSLSPTSGAPGTPVTINGTNFGSTQGSSTVTFNGVPASVTSWSSSMIVAVAPSNVTTGPIVVAVNSVPSSSSSVFTVTAPAIANLSPPAAAPGALVNINGSGFYSQGLTTQVYLNGVQVPIRYYGGNPTYPSMGNNQLTIQVPTGATSGNITVVVGSISSNSVPFTAESAPVITSISPLGGQIGSWPITIDGSGFGATQDTSTVTFCPGLSAQIVSWSDTEIQAVVPAGSTTGEISMQVGGITAWGPEFQITTVTQLTDSLGNTTNFAMGTTGGNWTFTSSQGPGCSTCTVRGNTSETVDARGNVLTHTDDLGQITTYTYDGNDNVTSVSQQLDPNTAATTSYTYNSFGEVLTMTDPLGNVTTNTYDAKGNLISVTTPRRTTTLLQASRSFPTIRSES